MTSSDVRYHEDFYTLRGMTEHFEFSEQLLRQIQKHGLMLPEIVKFGSEEIEIYSNLDIKIGGRIKKTLEKLKGLSQAIISAQEHIADLYHEAHGSTPTDMENSPEPAQIQSGQSRRKLFVSQRSPPSVRHYRRVFPTDTAAYRNRGGEVANPRRDH